MHYHMQLAEETVVGNWEIGDRFSNSRRDTKKKSMNQKSAEHAI